MEKLDIDVKIRDDILKEFDKKVILLYDVLENIVIEM